MYSFVFVFIGNIVKVMFEEFLLTYNGIDDFLRSNGSSSSSSNLLSDEINNDDNHHQISIHQKLLLNYQNQIEYMIEMNKSTIYINFQHIRDINHELSEAIEIEYYRFEPYLRYALQCIVYRDNPQYIFDIDRGQRELFVSFYNLPRLEHIRSMSTDKIGRLKHL